MEATVSLVLQVTVCQFNRHGYYAVVAVDTGGSNLLAFLDQLLFSCHAFFQIKQNLMEGVTVVYGLISLAASL